jgi:hypothetical protein
VNTLRIILHTGPAGWAAVVLALIGAGSLLSWTIDRLDGTFQLLFTRRGIPRFRRHWPRLGTRVQLPDGRPATVLTVNRCLDRMPDMAVVVLDTNRERWIPAFLLRPEVPE